MSFLLLLHRRVFTNNQDISALVGKVDIRKLAEFPQNDADAYSYSGSLCKSNQGLMEFVEMFKVIRNHAKIRIDEQSENMQLERREALRLTSPDDLTKV